MRQSRLAGSTVEVNAKQFEMLETGLVVVSTLMRTYAADEVLAEAHTDVVFFR